MKTLLVYPHCPDSFWGFRNALKFIAKKSTEPPLGLLTIAAMLPGTWEKRLVDMNIEPLRAVDLEWADCVFLSAMSIQRNSACEVIERCQRLGIRVIAGGPLFTSEPDAFPGVDHLVLGEAETSLPAFLSDLDAGTPKHLYPAGDWANIVETPIPLWELVKFSQYASMNLQYSRGCPFQCSFCDISVLFGREVRTKSQAQILSEMDKLYSLGWRGEVFLVDDNFIGNKKKLREDILPAITRWMTARGFPFSFYTECSINLADDIPLMQDMIGAGFNKVFIGIESTNEDSLNECNKYTNCKRDILNSIHTIQRFGFEVMGGFIIGFDNDRPSIFDDIIEFIQSSGIITAMVGLLNAPVNTKLYHQMKAEGRLHSEMTGDNTDFSMNFRPKMQPEQLMEGYRRVLNSIYQPEPFYARMRHFLTMKRQPIQHPSLKFCDIMAFFKSVYAIGLTSKERFQYWKMLLWTIFRSPRSFREAVTFAIYGYHFRKITCLTPGLSIMPRVIGSGIE
jgi:radical SAM superfamily enzyme YgiQ (UPF0313 family)